MLGSVKTLKQLRSGQVLIEVTRETQARNLLGQNELAGIPVKVTQHRSLNSSRGVIRSFELARMNETELLAELRNQGVTAARIVKQHRNGVERITPVIILTFALSVPPMQIHAEYLTIKVEPFIPNPLRCFKCQMYGHHQSTCQRSRVCAKCSSEEHGDSPCTAPVKCKNCSGDHPAFSSSCPKWIQEKEICRVKTVRNISYPEARKLVATTGTSTTAASGTQSYAEAASRPLGSGTAAQQSAPPRTRSVETQTDVINCTCIAPALTSSETQTDAQGNNPQQSASNKQNDSSKITLEQTNRESGGPGGVIRQNQLVDRRRGSKSPKSSPNRPRPRNSSVGSADGGGLGGGWRHVGSALRRRIDYPSSNG